jgi:hypothetical protein
MILVEVKDRNEVAMGVFIKAVWVLIVSEQFTSGDIPEFGVELLKYIYK